MPPGFVRRAVSPVHFEPLQAYQEDILCEGSDAEEGPEDHKAKRRRVEEAAQEYLSGKTLYISSARLKGPFPPSWRNPYVGKQRRRGSVESRQHGRLDVHHSLKPYKREAPSAPEPRDEIRLRKPDVGTNALTTQSRRTSPAQHTEATAHNESLLPTTRQDAQDPQRPVDTTASGLPKGASNSRSTKISSSQDREWLKISNKFGKSRSQNKVQSMTPTPAPRVLHEIPEYISTEALHLRSNSNSSESNHTPDRPQTSERPSGQPQPARGASLPRQPSPGGPRNVSHESSLLHLGPSVQEVDLNKPDSGGRQAYENAKRLSQRASHRAQSDWEAHTEAKKLAKSAVIRAMTSSPAVKEPTGTSTRGLDTSEVCASENKRSTHELPPSTNLPGFEYWKASYSPKRKSFREDLEAAKKRVRAEEKRRVSFTASGRVKDRRSKTTFRNSQQSGPSHSEPPVSLPQRGITDESGDKKQTGDSEPRAVEGTTSNQTGSMPEAQIVQHAGLTNGPSAPSTELLETEKQSLKFPSTDEGDSYFDLSTQAAMQKAQKSLHKDVVRYPSPNGHQHDMKSPLERVDENERLLGQHRISPMPEVLTPTAGDDLPMSTQAMMDAMSPFAVTTVKKPPLNDWRSASVSGSSSPLSPTTHDFGPISHSMSTTPSHSPAPVNEDPPIPLSALSKPTSTITSFSIAPNGTMTDFMQYDGQQQRQNYQMGDSDLDAALEEAGSFLGDWSVEKEAKYLQRSTAESRAS